MINSQQELQRFKDKSEKQSSIPLVYKSQWRHVQFAVCYVIFGVRYVLWVSEWLFCCYSADNCRIWLSRSRPEKHSLSPDPALVWVWNQSESACYCMAVAKQRSLFLCTVFSCRVAMRSAAKSRQQWPRQKKKSHFNLLCVCVCSILQ